MISGTLRDADGNAFSVTCAARNVWLDDGRNAADALAEADAAMAQLNASLASLTASIDALVANNLPE